MAAPESSSNSVTRWELSPAATFGDGGGDAGPARKRRRARDLLVASSLGLLSLGAALVLPAPRGVRLALIVAAFICASVPWVRALLRRRPRVAKNLSYLQSDADGLTRVTTEGSKALVRWDAPFGVTLFASYGRPTALLAFTSPTQTRYVPTRIDERSPADDETLARIAVLADLDLVDGIHHDAALAPATAAHLVRHLEHREKDALGRVFLSDSRRAPISLDRATLAVGERAFDLSSPLEWRALMFHESTGQGAALYQGTWVRQGTSEMVLVAPMPASIIPREQGSHRDTRGKLGQVLTRDLKLLQAPPEPPPAREMRVAIDRPFMMAVRRALADAPLASRSPTSQTSRKAPSVRGQVQ